MLFHAIIVIAAVLLSWFVHPACLGWILVSWTLPHGPRWWAVFWARANARVHRLWGYDVQIIQLDEKGEED